MRITQKQLRSLIREVLKEQNGFVPNSSMFEEDELSEEENVSGEDSRNTIPAPNFDPKQAYRDAAKRNAVRKAKPKSQYADRDFRDNEDSVKTAMLPPPMKKN